MLVSVFSVSSLCAQSHSGWWTGGNLGLGYYSGSDSVTNMVLGLDLPDITVMHNDTGLFASVSPFHADSFCEGDEDTQKQNNLYSFVNMKLGLDLLKDNRDWDIAPYVAVNWNPFKSGNNARVEGGLDITLFTSQEWGDTFPLRAKVATVNVGYGVRRETAYFTAGVSVDVVAFLYAVLSSEYSKVSKGALPAVASRGVEKPVVQPGAIFSKTGALGLKNMMFDEVRKLAGFLNRDKDVKCAE